MFPFRSSIRLVAWVLVLSLGPVRAVWAQNQGFMQDRGQRIEDLRKQFIRERAGLTPEEEKAFWPVYFDFQEATKRLRLDTRSKTLMLDRGVDNLTDAQVNELVQTIADQKQKEATLYADYIAKAKKVIPPRKLIKVYMAEREFVRVVLQRLRERGQPIPPELQDGNEP